MRALVAGGADPALQGAGRREPADGGGVPAARLATLKYAYELDSGRRRRDGEHAATPSCTSPSA